MGSVENEQERLVGHTHIHHTHKRTISRHAHTPHLHHTYTRTNICTYTHHTRDLGLLVHTTRTRTLTLTRTHTRTRRRRRRRANSQSSLNIHRTRYTPPTISHVCTPTRYTPSTISYVCTPTRYTPPTISHACTPTRYTTHVGSIFITWQKLGTVRRGRAARTRNCTPKTKGIWREGNGEADVRAALEATRHTRYKPHSIRTVFSIFVIHVNRARNIGMFGMHTALLHPHWVFA